MSGQQMMVPERKFLGAPTAFIYPALTAPVDPHQFYQTRKGLWIDSDFKDLVLPVAKKMQTLPKCAGRHFPLAVDASDDEIRSEFPSDQVWGASESCARIAEEVRRQWGNKAKGNLVDDAHMNIFHVFGVGGKVVALRVSWHVVDQEWRVSAFRPSRCRWSAGYRAFPCD